MADKVVDMEVDKMVEKVADMKVAMAANMVACMEVDKVADMDFSMIFLDFPVKFFGFLGKIF